MARPAPCRRYALMLTLVFIHVLARQQHSGVLFVLASSSTITNDHPHHAHHGSLQRGQILPNHSFSAEDLYRAYQEIQQDYQQRAFGKKNDWKLLNRKEGVEIRILQHPSDPSCPYVQMKAIIPTSVKDCWDFLKLDRWDQTMKVMDPFYEGVELIQDYRHGGVHMLLARKRTQKILAFGKRDFVFISVSEDQPLTDGTWVSGTVSVITDRVPRVPKYTRAYQDSIAFYKPLAPDKTELTIVCRIDLNDHSANGSGGNMPMWLYVKTIGKTGARSVINMRNHLVKDAQERAAKARINAAQHERGKQIHQQALPWMEWPSPTLEKKGKERAPPKRPPPLFGVRRREERRKEAEELPRVVRLSKKLHQILLPWMEWPEKEDEEELVEKKKTLKRKLHEILLPWMEWTEDEEDEDETQKDEVEEDATPFTLPWE